MSKSGRSPPHPCHACAKDGATLKCSRCLSVIYCNAECQAKGWKEMGHRKACKRLRKLLDEGRGEVGLSSSAGASLAGGDGGSASHPPTASADICGDPKNVCPICLERPDDYMGPDTEDADEIELYGMLRSLSHSPSAPASPHTLCNLTLQCKAPSAFSSHIITWVANCCAQYAGEAARSSS
jgi:hypothetical protein